MKGDFTRLTFRPQKHYTSVRMQQGRLQLDSDWNEQVDVQSHLLHTQSIDMIGFESGVPSATLESGELNRDGFKISIAPDGDDLVIAPGHLYVNGTLCELESGTFLTVNANADKEIEVETLTLDDRSLEPKQWLEVYADINGKLLNPTQRVRIEKIDSKQRKLTLSEAIAQPGRMRRLVTYLKQPDLPSSDSKLTDGSYTVYLDVWERHITSVEDPKIREVALSIPDTTTRTQTVWQLKLKPFDQLSEATDKLLPDALDDLEWDSLIKERWFPSIQALRDRMTQAKMNACAKNCPTVGNSANMLNSPAGQTGSDRRLDNQLYRVEIHTPGTLGIATFKWSRDNGSVVSPIDTQKGIQGGVIPIQKSGLEAWTSAKPGQWIEISSAQQELQGQPGVLAPFQQATDTRILFNDARIAGGSIPVDASTVRRWDHATQQPSILTSSEWTPLENGIKVCFQPATADTRYETGDYWLIPARSIDNDIQWTDNGAKPNPEPLAQSPAGIRHEYCLLALVKVADGKFVLPQSDPDPIAAQAKVLKDCRVVFPPLMRCVDKDQGLFTGTLEVQSDFFVTGNGRAGIGTRSLTARLQVQGLASTQATGTISLAGDGMTVTAIDPEVKRQLIIGDKLLIKDQAVLVTNTNPLMIAPPLNLENQTFFYPPAIARFDDSDRKTQFAVTAMGNVGIGTITPTQKLEVIGSVKADNFFGNGATLTGVVKTNGENTMTGPLIVTGNLKVDGTLMIKDNSLSGAKLINDSITEDKLSPDIVSNPKLKNGSVTKDKLADKAVTSSKIADAAVGTSELADGSVTIGKLEPKARPVKNLWEDGAGNSLFYNGRVSIGQSPKAPTAKLEIQGEDNSNNAGSLHVTNELRKSLFFVQNNGNIGINTDEPKTALHVVGTVAIGDQNTGTPANIALFVDGNVFADGNVNAKAFTQTSSRTLKQNIIELSSQDVTELLASLNPVKFNYTTDQPEIVHAGFIAEEVPDLVASTDRQAVRLGDVVAILTKAVKDQRQAIASLSRIAKDQQAAIAALTEHIQQLERD